MSAKKLWDLYGDIDAQAKKPTAAVASYEGSAAGSALETTPVPRVGDLASCGASCSQQRVLALS